jgi:predicted negative regulator of RcsB-dependent stress response
MEERAEKIREIIRTRGRQIIMGLMGLLLLRGYIFWVDSEFHSDATAQPQQLNSLNTVITQATLDAVQTIITPLPDLTTSSYAVLARIDMFDPKTVINADTLNARTNQTVTQARSALDQGNVAEAQRLLEDAGANNPGSPTAHALRKKIQEKIAADANKPPSST